MARSAVGVFEDRNAAESAVGALQQKGVPARDIREIGSHDVEPARTVLSAPRVDREYLVGAAMAAGLACSFAGLLVAIGVVSFSAGSVPMRLLYGLVALLVTAGFGAALGALVGTITGAGIPQEHIDYYVEAVEHGATLVIVFEQPPERAEFAARIMRRHGAADLERMIESWHGLAYP